LTDIVDYLQP